MNMLTVLIMRTCMYWDSETCIQDLHWCIRDNYNVQWFDEIRKQDEILLPKMIDYCLPEIKHEPNSVFDSE